MQYGYTQIHNTSRLTSMTYPSNDYTVNYNYATGLDSNISRLSSLSQTVGGVTTPLESYKYLGLDTVVERDQLQNGVNLTYIARGQIGDAGDQYVGLDRFGRIIDQNWVNSTTGLSTDDFAYGYNQDSDVLYRENLVDPTTTHDELYGYDGLNQLTSFQRGTLNATHNGLVGNPTRSQSWTPDALGNFTSVTTNSTPENRTVNQQNEYTAIGPVTPSYDNNGNLTADGSGNTYMYDAWNRLVAVQSNGTTVASYRYDGLSRRITAIHGSDTRELFYSAQGQVLAEWYDGLLQARNVWSPVYVNALVVRDQARFNNGTLNDRYLVQQDANWNVTALVNPAGTVVERYADNPYGAVTVLNADFTVRGSSVTAMPYLWQGMRYEWAVNLYFTFSGRVVSPSLMRPLQTDPLGLGPDINPYRWEGNGPTGAVDPSGLRPIGSWIEERLGAFSLIWIGVLSEEAVIDASSGASYKEGLKAGEDWKRSTKEGRWGDIGNPELVGNAARHLTWQALLTIKHGYTQAKVIGELHEIGEEGVDTLLDQYNNKVGRKIGQEIIDSLRMDKNV